MTSRNKTIVLIVLIAAIVGTIVYIEAKKAPHATGLTVQQTIANETSTMADATGTMGQAGTGSTTAPGPTPAQFLASRASIVAAEAKQYQAAPEIVDPSGFINSAPFKLSDFVGKKVVLLDFWTYSCINCIRTLPYLTSWYQKYKDQGLVIVGIHTPEFDFEHDINNVQAAVQKFGIDYPVVLDNDMGTWDAYGNQYWPHEYLINIDGFIVHDHIGEGDYDTTEAAIQAALAERDQALGIPTSTLAGDGMTTPTDTIGINYNAVGSPETYFGAERNQYLANGVQGTQGDQALTAPDPSTLTLNELYLDGTWDFEDQYAQSVNAGAKILYTYNSKNVYIVAAAASPVTVQVLRDGQPVGAAAGTDVSGNGTVTIQANRLYNIISDPKGYGVHTLELIIQNPGLQAFTFTFG